MATDSGLQRTAAIEAFVTERVDKHPDDSARVTAEHLGITRQAVYRHLTRLVKEKKLTATGSTRRRKHASALAVYVVVELDVSPALEEDCVWRKPIAPQFGDVPVQSFDIFCYGFTEPPVSRSQAKRLLARFDRFKEVMLDFKHVPMVGQAFADEVFRVFQEQHPDIRLWWRNAEPDVERMIRRAIAKGKEDAQG